MGIKTPEVAYYTVKLQTTGRSQLFAEWADAPVTKREIDFLSDLLERASLKELAAKYGYTISGIAQWKRRLFCRLHHYDMQRLTR